MWNRGALRRIGGKIDHERECEANAAFRKFESEKIRVEFIGERAKCEHEFRAREGRRTKCEIRCATRR
jgi:hypothetical protein